MAKKSKKRRAWTATEVRELKALAKKKTAAAKIAKKLKRTEGATRQKAFSIGLSLDFSFLIPPQQRSISGLSDAGPRCGPWRDGVRAFVGVARPDSL